MPLQKGANPDESNLSLLQPGNQPYGQDIVLSTVMLTRPL
jgi:hypothetical protein